MSTIDQNTTVDEAFFQPLTSLPELCSQFRFCPEFSDSAYLRCGVQRVLESCKSGRGFLQEHLPRLVQAPTQSNYFATLQSSRRVALLTEINQLFGSQADQTLPDRLAHIQELDNYDCFAADGHWHQAATHDPRHEGVKMSVGHFYSLNLRRHTLCHLATGEGLHEHDMSALKRVKPKGLRHRVVKGRRVLMVYDKAGIDFGHWDRCRRECAVYFLSRVKENMILEWVETNDWDRSDPRHRGVREDVRVRTRQGQMLRIICYIDPISGKWFEFLTNVMDLPPGILVELYRRRWDVEKVFDEIKNKLEEKKAWGTSLEARQTQALFIVLTHNMLLNYEQGLTERHGVKNEAEDKRRRQRREASGKGNANNRGPVSTLVLQALQATQRSVKLIRWIRQSMRDQLAEAAAVLRLKALYASP